MLLRAWKLRWGSASWSSCSGRGWSSSARSFATPPPAGPPAPTTSTRPAGLRHERYARHARHVVLGIESTCDETAVAIVDDQRRVLADVMASQWGTHKDFGGVMPSMAAREHERKLPQLLDKALADSKLSRSDLTAVSVAVGPGLAPCLKAGYSFAHALASGLRIPLLPVNHIEAHIAVSRFASSRPVFPLLALVVSGGHTQVVYSSGVGSYFILGSTLDDAVGEAFDKVARLLHVFPAADGMCGGAALEAVALKGDPQAYSLPLPLVQQRTLNFSYAGLKGALRRQVRELENIPTQLTPSQPQPRRRARVFGAFSCDLAAQLSSSSPSSDSEEQSSSEEARRGADTRPPPPTTTTTKPPPRLGSFSPALVDGAPILSEQQRADLAASFQHVAVEHLVLQTRRTIEALRRNRTSCAEVSVRPKQLVLCGGVATNKLLRQRIQALAEEKGMLFTAPSTYLCSDNALMIAWTAMERALMRPPLPLQSAPVDCDPVWPVGPKLDLTLGRRLGRETTRRSSSGEPARFQEASYASSASS